MTPPQTIPVLILIGPIGVGKTSVAAAIAEILENRSTPHAFIDLDHLRYSYPRPKDDPFNERLGLKNLAAIWKNYKESGVKCLIIPNVVEKRERLADFEAAIPGAEIFVVRLHASIDLIHKRLHAREAGDSLNWHLNRAVELAGILEKNKVEDIVVDTEHKSIQEIAEEIIGHWKGLQTVQ